MRIVLADDDRLVSISLKQIIETDDDIEVVGTASNAHEAVDLFKKLRPDVMLMDIRMGEVTGLDAGEEILSIDSTTKILYLTTFADDEYIIKALKMGAKGYILKQNFESIIPSLKSVLIGQSVYDSNIAAKIPKLLSNGEPDFASYGISGKESEIIKLIADGLTNREIASKLFLSEGTIRNSISVILEKLSLRSRTELAIFYYKSRGSV